MGMEGAPQRPNLKEELQRKMAELKEKTIKALEEKEEKLASIYAEGKDAEEAQEKLDEDIKKLAEEIKEFKVIAKEARDAGLPEEEIPSDEEMTVALKSLYQQKEGLVDNKGELMGQAKELASDPGVMNKIHEKALTENEVRDHEESIGEALNEAVDEVKELLATRMLNENHGKEYYGTFGVGIRTLAEELTKNIRTGLIRAGNTHDAVSVMPPVGGRGGRNFEEGMREIIKAALRESDKVNEYFVRKQRELKDNK